MVAEAHSPELENAKCVRDILHYHNVVLNPLMNIQEAIAVFDTAEAETLAVVEADGEHKPIGTLSESHAVRRYAEESEQRRREVIGDV